MKNVALESTGSSPSCRFCGHRGARTFADLGTSPLANSYLAPDQLAQMEPTYPLHAFVCESCLLVQLAEFETAEHIFSQYAYFSSYSQSWVAHARAYTEMIVARLGLDASSQVIEIASNDGYLLQHMQRAGLDVIGVEPAKNVAAAAIAKGIPTITRFFGVTLARELAADGHRADLLLGNNVLAHVPDLNDFVAGLKIALQPSGVITMEFPHLARLIDECQFDTIYHEHFSYFSLHTVERVFARHALTLFDVEELPTHGGSLRIYACHADAPGRAVTPRVAALKAAEQRMGLTSLDIYESFARRVAALKREILDFLVGAKRDGKTVVGYGAPAKGNTLLNYCGIRRDMIDYTVDASPHKQGYFLPGSRIPILAPQRIAVTKPDYVVILPWNLKAEITAQMALIREWGGRFVTFIPRLALAP